MSSDSAEPSDFLNVYTRLYNVCKNVGEGAENPSTDVRTEDGGRAPPPGRSVAPKPSRTRRCRCSKKRCCNCAVDRPEVPTLVPIYGGTGRGGGADDTSAGVSGVCTLTPITRNTVINGSVRGIEKCTLEPIPCKNGFYLRQKIPAFEFAARANRFND
uniref:Uncharacterized protein n=1 Tax=Sipha flava TaxID=143950 RepID=A0A2S2QYK0_9HEMI